MPREAPADPDSKLPPTFTQMFPEAWVPGTMRVRIRMVPGEGQKGREGWGRGDMHTSPAKTHAAGAHTRAKELPWPLQEGSPASETNP